jgi:glutamate synthase domain-containing protein 2
LARSARRATPTKSNSGGTGQLLGDVLDYLAALLEPATLIWEVGSGYFCCRNKDGSFSSEKFTTLAVIPHIKMVELKLSQGAKPGHGGVLPAAKVSPEIARIRDVPMGQNLSLLRDIPRSPSRSKCCSSLLSCDAFQVVNPPDSNCVSATLGSSSP